MRPRLGSLLTPLRIAAIYLVFGIGALLLSDLVLVGLVDDPERLRRLQAVKGAAEVVLTAVLIYALVATYRRATEERTREVERARDRFAFLNNLLRHHVLNRMNVVQGHVDGMIGEGEGDRDRLRTIQRQSEAVVDLVDNVRTLAHARSGAAETRAIPLAEVVESVLASFRHDHPAASLDAAIPDGLRVEADDSLEAVIESLLRNAVEHNDAEAPEVRITAEAMDDRVTIRVVDNGPGIPEGALEGPADANRRGDEGFGLYLVASLVEHHGGQVRVEAGGAEEGVVAVDLPRAG